MTKWRSVAALVLLTAGFASFSIRVKRNVAQAEAFKQFEGRLGHGDRAPDFELMDLDGSRFSLSRETAEQQIVLINFWATWCPPCRLEMPMLERLHERYAEDGLRILAVDVGESTETVSAFLETRSLSFPVLLDQDRTVSTRFRVKAFPTTYLVDGNGVVIHAAEGIDPYLSYHIESQLEARPSEELQ